MELDLNGYTFLPPGKVAAVVTYLEMTAPPEGTAPAPPPGLSVRHVQHPTLEEYRELYRAIGEPWLWFSRLNTSDEDLRAILADPLVEVHFLEHEGAAKGLLELDFRESGEVELVFFGITPDLIGKGAGRFLIGHGQNLAWSRSPRRFWLHTCTLDHPEALQFYRKAGFRPYQLAVEVADDPRLTGKAARSAGPRVPIIES